MSPCPLGAPLRHPRQAPSGTWCGAHIRTRTGTVCVQREPHVRPGPRVSGQMVRLGRPEKESPLLTSPRTCPLASVPAAVRGESQAREGGDFRGRKEQQALGLHHFHPCRFPQGQLPLNSLSRTALLSLQPPVSCAPISALPVCLAPVYLPSQPACTECLLHTKRRARCGVLCTSAPARETHTGDFGNNGASTLQKNKQLDP